eukprot:529794-Amphidinium_carterae.1
MLSRARSALADKKAALSTRHISIASRLSLHSFYIRCHFLQTVCVLQLFPKSLMARLDAEYVKGLRVCTDQVVMHSGDVKLSNEDLLAKFCVPALLVLMERRSLAFFLKLATVAHRTHLGTFQLQTTRRFMWASFAVNHRDAWLVLVKAYKQPDKGGVRKQGPPAASVAEDKRACPYPSQEQEQAQLQEVTPEGIVPPSDIDRMASSPRPSSACQEAGLAVHEPSADTAPAKAPFACLHCSYKGKSNAGLQAHLRRAHKIFDPLSIRVSSSTCAACDLGFGTRWRVLESWTVG